MSRFDQLPDVNYGECTDCTEVFATKADTDAHMHSTFEASDRSKGHRVRIANPTRPERIRREVDSLVDDAMDRAIERVLEDVGRHIDRGEITEDEAREALRYHSDFADGFEEWLS